MNRSFLYFAFPLIMVFLSCGSDKLEVKGDPEAIEMGESMIKAMGGKKAWTKIKSVYIRTLNTSPTNMQTSMIEEWTNLDEPKFISRKSIDSEPYFQIIDNNDGWIIRNGEVSMLPPGSVTDHLKWHDQYLLVNLKRLAIGGEQVELKVNGDNRFDMLINGKQKCSFELDDNYLLKKYYVNNDAKRPNALIIEEYSEYEGYKFPLRLSSENSMDMYKTDYFDPSPLTAEKAFNVSFNPNEMVN